MAIDDHPVLDGHLAATRVVHVDRPRRRPSLSTVGSSVLGIVAAIATIAAALDLGAAVGWSAVGVVAAWAATGAVLTLHGRDTIGLLAVAVAVAVATVTVAAAFNGHDAATAFAIAAVPTTMGILLALAPDGVTTTTRRWVAATVVAIGIAGGIALAVSTPTIPAWLVTLVACLTVGVGAATARATCRTGSVVERARLQWIGWGLTVAGAVALAFLGLHAISDWPRPVEAVLVACGAIPAIGLLASAHDGALHAIGDVLVETIVAIGLVGFVGVVYMVVVVGLAGVPDESERTVLALSILAALVVAASVVPIRHRLHTEASIRVHGEDSSPDHALETFATRMSRSIPMDELLLQLVEALQKSMRLSSAEVWTGSDGRYELTVSVPHRPFHRIELGPESMSVASRAHVQGNAWLGVWIPSLLERREDRTVRFTSVAHLGELLGFIITERPAVDTTLDEEDEHRVLIDIARQLGLALHNVRLDNALQASLDDLKVANDELVASRARIVAATDESRRRIERNLHDGAQQHLVALAVKVGLIRQLLDANPSTATAMLEELREDVQATLTELRELAHGIYPPRLRDRGLADALQAAADRSPLPTRVAATGLNRYGADIETAIYFCCLEAIQNAGKHAGDGATITVTVRESDESLEFSVVDDGAGFDPATTVSSSGFVNMEDRLGAFAGRLDVTSAPGSGTSIRGHVPLR